MRLVLYCFFVVCLLITALELSLRAMHGGAEASGGEYVLHPLLGWTLRPESSFAFSSEGAAEVRANSLGFRDVEHRVENDAERLRIVLLGDSFLEAKQVAFEDSLSQLLEAKLAQCLGREVEIFNFAIQGYGTVQQSLVYSEIARRYHPDHVVLAFYQGNDVFDNHPTLNPNNTELAPYARFNEKGLQFETPAGVVFAVRKALLDYFPNFHLSRRLQQLVATVQRKQMKSETVLSTEEYEWVLLREPLREELKVAWELSLKLIADLRRRVHAQQASFHVLLIPQAIIVHPDSAQREAFKKRYAISDFGYAKRRLLEVVPEQELIDLAPEFLKSVAQLRSPLFGFKNARPGYGHLNESGHERASDILSRRLCDEILAKAN